MLVEQDGFYLNALGEILKIEIKDDGIPTDKNGNKYIVDGTFMFQWENGFLKIDTKNKDIIEVEDYEYNDVTFEEYVFERCNETNDDEGKKRDIYVLHENAEDYDDVDTFFEDNESKPIDPNKVERVYLETFRN